MLSLYPSKSISKTISKYLSKPFPTRLFSDSKIIVNDTNSVSTTWILPDGSERKVRGKLGENLLDLARREDIELEGACEGSIACSTCHVILEPNIFKKLDEPTDEENDMLDLAFGLSETSRLGCQVKLSKDLDNMVIKIPSATRNMAVDGHKPKPH